MSKLRKEIEKVDRELEEITLSLPVMMRENLEKILDHVMVLMYSIDDELEKGKKRGGFFR